MSDPYLDVPNDVAGQYRHHAMLIADGVREVPTRAVLIEVLADGRCMLRPLGTAIKAIHFAGIEFASAAIGEGLLLNQEGG